MKALRHLSNPRWMAPRKPLRSPSRNRRELYVEPLETRHLLAGVTMLTHGFNSNVDGWVAQMAQAIADRPDLTVDQAIYRLEVTDPEKDNGPLTVTAEWISGQRPGLDEPAFPEIALLLDWSDVAGTLFGAYTRSTFDVAAAVAEQLVTPDFVEDLGWPLASLPFHLLGHSRGGSLVGELAHQLGLRGIWVEQVTTLDPHPVDGVDEPFGIDFGDAPMVAWDNVVYWDNYWRENSSLFDFNGEHIPNVHNVQLNEAILSVGGYFYSHSDVHLWYYGTIDTSDEPPANNGDIDVPDAWYGGEHPGRTESGFAFSRLVGGSREPAGLSNAFEHGVADREPVPVTLPAWPNVLELRIASEDRTFYDGASVPLGYYCQDEDSDATITFALDEDRNPFNANQHAVLDRSVASSGALLSADIELPTINVPTGTYHILATITDATGHTRFAYAREPVYVDNPFANLPPSDVLLESEVVLENVAGAVVGRVTVIDPNPHDVHRFVLSDDRFEVVDSVLRLRPADSLRWHLEPQVELFVTVVDSGHLELSPPKRFLIAVQENPFPWHNLRNRLDVQPDGQLSPLDALRVINEWNQPQVSGDLGRLPAVRPADQDVFLDVNADGFVSPLDALIVINAWNYPDA